MTKPDHPAAYLDAADAALRQAMASGPEPPAVTKYRAIGRQLFSATSTFGEREAMFFAKDNKEDETRTFVAAMIRDNLPSSVPAVMRGSIPLVWHWTTSTSSAAGERVIADSKRENASPE